MLNENLLHSSYPWNTTSRNIRPNIEVSESQNVYDLTANTNSVEQTHLQPLQNPIRPRTPFVSYISESPPNSQITLDTHYTSNRNGLKLFLEHQTRNHHHPPINAINIENNSMHHLSNILSSSTPMHHKNNIHESSEQIVWPQRANETVSELVRHTIHYRPYVTQPPQLPLANNLHQPGYFQYPRPTSPLSLYHEQKLRSKSHGSMIMINYNGHRAYVPADAIVFDVQHELDRIG